MSERARDREEVEREEEVEVERRRKISRRARCPPHPQPKSSVAVRSPATRKVISLFSQAAAFCRVALFRAPSPPAIHVGHLRAPERKRSAIASTRAFQSVGTEVCFFSRRRRQREKEAPLPVSESQHWRFSRRASALIPPFRCLENKNTSSDCLRRRGREVKQRFKPP